ncbi:MAG: hypothetical protein SGCHY_000601 [Lobulomycetales sp.]
MVVHQIGLGLAGDRSVLYEKKGSLSKIWLAAHWERKLSKNQFLKTNIASSVHAILQHSPGDASALRLSGHLLLGVSRIYSRKARYLLEDAADALQKIRMAFKPVVVDLNLDQQTSGGADTLPDALTELDIKFFGETLIDLAAIGGNTVDGISGSQSSSISVSQSSSVEKKNRSIHHDHITLNKSMDTSVLIPPPQNDIDLDLSQGIDDAAAAGEWDLGLDQGLDLLGHGDSMEIDAFSMERPRDANGADISALNGPVSPLDASLELARDAGNSIAFSPLAPPDTSAFPPGDSIAGMEKDPLDRFSFEHIDKSQHPAADAGVINTSLLDVDNNNMDFPVDDEFHPYVCLAPLADLVSRIMFEMPEGEQVVAPHKATKAKKRKLYHIDERIELSAGEFKRQLLDASDLLLPHAARFRQQSNSMKSFIPISRSSVQVAKLMAQGAAYVLDRPYNYRVPLRAQATMQYKKTKELMKEDKLLGLNRPKDAAGPPLALNSVSGVDETGLDGAGGDASMSMAEPSFSAVDGSFIDNFEFQKDLRGSLAQQLPDEENHKAPSMIFEDVDLNLSLDAGFENPLEGESAILDNAEADGIPQEAPASVNHDHAELQPCPESEQQADLVSEKEAAVAAEQVDENAEDENGFTKSTLETITVLKEEFSKQGCSEISFGELNAKATRTMAVKMFFDVLVLKSRDIIDVEQLDGGDIKILEKQYL